MRHGVDLQILAAIPFVMTNCYAGGDHINYVGVDDFEVGRRGAEYLATRGHASMR